MQENSKRSGRDIEELRDEYKLYEALVEKAKRYGDDVAADWYQYCADGVEKEINDIMAVSY